MNILITGGAGFIGSNIVDAYVAAGHKVTVVDNFYTGKKANLNPKAGFCKLDIRKRELENVFRKGRFEVVNHHAAQIDVRKSVDDPSFDAGVNILGLLNVLELCRKYGVKKVIFSSSGGTIYGECPGKAPDENAPANPLSPYGVAKFTSEKYLEVYRSLYDLNYVALRYGNVYGPRQDPHGEAGVVAIFAMRMLKGEPVLIFGDGKQLRDYVYVKDVVGANLRALKNGKSGIFNVGTGGATSVNKLFTSLAGLTGYNKKAVYKPQRPGELQRSVLNIKRSSHILGWQPKTNLNQGLAETVNFFRTKF